MKRASSIHRAALLAALAVSLLAPAASFAAPPPNDDFANAIEVTAPEDFESGSLAEATVEAGEPAGGTGSVWYRMTATSRNPVAFNTCDTPMHITTDVAVYTGSAVGSLTRLKRGESPCQSRNTGQVAVVRPPAVGQVLYLRVSNRRYHRGPFGFRVAPPATSDSFPGATVPAGSSTVAPIDNTNASAQVNEPAHAYPAKRSVWWTWKAPAGSIAIADVCDSTRTAWPGSSVREASIVAYTGSALSTLVPAPEAASTYCPWGEAYYASGITRWLAGQPIARISADTGTRPTANLALRVRSGQPPAGDAFAAARPLTGTTVDETFDSTFATAEPGEPMTTSRLSHGTVWFRWTAAQAATAIIDRCQGGHPIAYRGQSLETLQPVSAIASGMYGGACEHRFGVEAGEAISLQGGPYGLPRDGVVRMRSGTPPSNDRFTQAKQLSGAPAAASGGLMWARRDDEPGLSGAGASVWFKWTAPAAGTYRVHTCGSNLPTYPTVSYGDTVDSQTTVGAVYDTDTGLSCSGADHIVKFSAVQGRTYRILVVGYPDIDGVSGYSLKLDAR